MLWSKNALRSEQTGYHEFAAHSMVAFLLCWKISFQWDIPAAVAAIIFLLPPPIPIYALLFAYFRTIQIDREGGSKAIAPQQKFYLFQTYSLFRFSFHIFVCSLSSCFLFLYQTRVLFVRYGNIIKLCFRYRSLYYYHFTWSLLVFCIIFWCSCSYQRTFVWICTSGVLLFGELKSFLFYFEFFFVF